MTIDLPNRLESLKSEMRRYQIGTREWVRIFREAVKVQDLLKEVAELEEE
jgi:hypothetical protein